MVKIVIFFFMTSAPTMTKINVVSDRVILNRALIPEKFLTSLYKLFFYATEYVFRTLPSTKYNQAQLIAHRFF